MPTISANGITIAYDLHHPHTTLTRKPTVLLINGLADTKETWSLQLPPLLSAGYPVLAFDNRGIGASSRPTTQPYTAALLAADAKALVDALSIPKPFHILGASMGGMIAQSYALAYPEDVLSVILACTYAKPNLFCTRRFAYWADVAASMGVSTVMRDVCSWGFTQDFFEPAHAAALAEFDEAMQTLDLSVPEYLCQLNVIQVFDTTRDVHRLKGLKVMVLAGEEDILIPTALSKELAGMIDGSEWKTVKGGHCCLWEMPEEFNQAMLEFLEKASR